MTYNICVRLFGPSLVTASSVFSLPSSTQYILALLCCHVLLLTEGRQPNNTLAPTYNSYRDYASYDRNRDNSEVSSTYPQRLLYSRTDRTNHRLTPDNYVSQRLSSDDRLLDLNKDLIKGDEIGKHSTAKPKKKKKKSHKKKRNGRKNERRKYRGRILKSRTNGNRRKKVTRVTPADLNLRWNQEKNTWEHIIKDDQRTKNSVLDDKNSKLEVSSLHLNYPGKSFVNSDSVMDTRPSNGGQHVMDHIAVDVHTNVPINNYKPLSNIGINNLASNRHNHQYSTDVGDLDLRRVKDSHNVTSSIIFSTFPEGTYSSFRNSVGKDVRRTVDSRNGKVLPAPNSSNINTRFNHHRSDVTNRKAYHDNVFGIRPFTTVLYGRSFGSSPVGVKTTDRGDLKMSPSGTQANLADSTISADRYQVMDRRNRLRAKHATRANIQNRIFRNRYWSRRGPRGWNQVALHNMSYGVDNSSGNFINPFDIVQPINANSVTPQNINAARFNNNANLNNSPTLPYEQSTISNNSSSGVIYGRGYSGANHYSFTLNSTLSTPHYYRALSNINRPITPYNWRRHRTNTYTSNRPERVINSTDSYVPRNYNVRNVSEEGWKETAFQNRDHLNNSEINSVNNFTNLNLTGNVSVSGQQSIFHRNARSFDAEFPTGSISGQRTPYPRRRNMTSVSSNRSNSYLSRQDHLNNQESSPNDILHRHRSTSRTSPLSYNSNTNSRRYGQINSGTNRDNSSRHPSNYQRSRGGNTNGNGYGNRNENARTLDEEVTANQGSSAPKKRPNIVLIITDDLDVELGSLNYMPRLQTLLRREGGLFPHSYTSTPMCCPSRSSLLTGMYIHNHEVYTNNDNCSSTRWQETFEQRTFATYLSQAGYNTGYFGKYLNKYKGPYTPAGWQDWMGLRLNSRYYNYTVYKNGDKIKYGDSYPRDYFPHVITNEGIRFIRENHARTDHIVPTTPPTQRGGPPTSDDSSSRTHPGAPISSRGHHSSSSPTRPRQHGTLTPNHHLPADDSNNFSRGNTGTTHHNSHHGSSTHYPSSSTPSHGSSTSQGTSPPMLLVLSYPAPHGPEDSAPEHSSMYMNVTDHHTVAYNYAPNPDKQWILQYTERMTPTQLKFTNVLMTKRVQTLQTVDIAIERIVSELRRLGELDNTYMFFTSDHGYHLGQFGLIKGKSMPFEFDIKVPLLVRGPGIVPSTEFSEITLNVDLAPTFLDIAGLTPPPQMDGRSLLPVMTQTQGRGTWRDSFLVESSGRHRDEDVLEMKAQKRYLQMNRLMDIEVRINTTLGFNTDSDDDYFMGRGFGASENIYGSGDNTNGSDIYDDPILLLFPNYTANGGNRNNYSNGSSIANYSGIYPGDDGEDGWFSSVLGMQNMPLFTSKHEHLEVVCQNQELQEPCRLLKKWRCEHDGFRWRLKKCRPRVKLRRTNCVCEPEMGMGYLVKLDPEERRRQRIFLRRHVSQDMRQLSPRFLKAFVDVDSSEIARENLRPNRHRHARGRGSSRVARNANSDETTLPGSHLSSDSIGSDMDGGNANLRRATVNHRSGSINHGKLSNSHRRTTGPRNNRIRNADTNFNSHRRRSGTNRKRDPPTSTTARDYGENSASADIQRTTNRASDSFLGTSRSITDDVDDEISGVVLDRRTDSLEDPLHAYVEEEELKDIERQIHDIFDELKDLEDASSDTVTEESTTYANVTIKEGAGGCVAVGGAVVDCPREVYSDRHAWRSSKHAIDEEIRRLGRQMTILKVIRQHLKMSRPRGSSRHIYMDYDESAEEEGGSSSTAFGGPNSRKPGRYGSNRVNSPTGETSRLPYETSIVTEVQPDSLRTIDGQSVDDLDSDLDDLYTNWGTLFGYDENSDRDPEVDGYIVSTGDPENSEEYDGDLEDELYRESYDGEDEMDGSTTDVDGGSTSDPNHFTYTGGYRGNKDSTVAVYVPGQRAVCWCNRRAAIQQHLKEQKLRRLNERLRLRELRVAKRKERKERRRRNRNHKEKPCNLSHQNCYHHDNHHWKTPPLWTDGSFCACLNAANNTYWCVRTINSSHNTLYCEFITGLITYYDLNIDPYQLRNVAFMLDNSAVAELHNMLTRLRSCKGPDQCDLITTAEFKNENETNDAEDTNHNTTKSSEITTSEYPSTDPGDSTTGSFSTITELSNEISLTDDRPVTNQISRSLYGSEENVPFVDSQENDISEAGITDSETSTLGTEPSMRRTAWDQLNLYGGNESSRRLKQHTEPVITSTVPNTNGNTTASPSLRIIHDGITTSNYNNGDSVTTNVLFTNIGNNHLSRNNTDVNLYHYRNDRIYRTRLASNRFRSSSPRGPFETTLHNHTSPRDALRTTNGRVNRVRGGVDSLRVHRKKNGLMPYNSDVSSTIGGNGVTFLSEVIVQTERTNSVTDDNSVSMHGHRIYRNRSGGINSNSVVDDVVTTAAVDHKGRRRGGRGRRPKKEQKKRRKEMRRLRKEQKRIRLSNLLGQPAVPSTDPVLQALARQHHQRGEDEVTRLPRKSRQQRRRKQRQKRWRRFEKKLRELN